MNSLGRAGSSQMDLPREIGSLAVHVCVGADDQYVSRQQGRIDWDGSRWVLTNEGRLPIRLPVARLLLGRDQSPLASGFTPLFVVVAVRRRRLPFRAHQQRNGHRQ